MNMDQIVFIFDVEQLVPLEGGMRELDESLLETRLNCVKQAALRIVTFCTDDGQIRERRKELPSFGFM